MIKVLIVCLGNICRSPTAEAVMRGRVISAEMEGRFEIDSAGTAAYHVGNPPDTRSQAAASRRLYDLSPLRARQLNVSDFDYFDYILAADHQNLKDINNLRSSLASPGKATVALFMDVLPDHPVREIPDPYYGGEDGFEIVLDLCEEASDAWLEKLV